MKWLNEAPTEIVLERDSSPWIKLPDNPGFDDEEIRGTIDEANTNAERFWTKAQDATDPTERSWLEEVARCVAFEGAHVASEFYRSYERQIVTSLALDLAEATTKADESAQDSQRAAETVRIEGLPAGFRGNLIVNVPPRPMRRKIERDRSGQAVAIVEEPLDAP